MKKITAFVLLGISIMAQAKEEFPLSCRVLPIDELVVLKAKQQQMVLFHNVFTNDVWITHPVSDPGASAGWSSRLEAGNWSAFVVDKETFELNCIESRPGHEQQIACRQVLQVCEWPAVKIPAENTGMFWAGENLPLKELIAHLNGRGFIMPMTSNS